MNSDHAMTPPAAQKEVRSHLNNPEETLFMQVFVEEVGIWMDSLDPYKHVITCDLVYTCGLDLLIRPLVVFTPSAIFFAR